MGAMHLIEDYKLEELLRCPYRFHKQKEQEDQAASDVNWRQLVQYAVSHTIKDYYTLPASQRKSLNVADLVNRHWSNRGYKFESREHFWEIKRKVISHLSNTLTSQQHEENPMVLFEKWDTYVSRLDLQMSLIFQAIFGHPNASNSAYTVQKFIVDNDDEVITAFQHMAAVFCFSAFARLPEKIEVFTILDGKKRTFYPDEHTIEASMDYMRLIRDFLPEAVEIKKFDAKSECRSCPFQNDCYSRFETETVPTNYNVC
ncbi:hypothetical protein [Paenibacillus eucommiae]|uniref:PD-(D/E)XK endonuclease-like domain-containing protein n=1 Tax=Paenibacillus eucommiae TaxID=1355755 RepID=A0ABS4IXY7_9BACL|nr:hypothetical protein [Paenibacillus eucommiae]MBP1992451.1 hypothetical protein [Paenibacillus eucommiae]